MVVSTRDFEKSFDLLFAHLAMGLHYSDYILDGCVSIFILIKNHHIALVLVGCILELTVLLQVIDKSWKCNTVSIKVSIEEFGFNFI